MTALLRGKDVSGFPVVDVSTGEDIAEVRDLIFDPSKGVVSGFTLGKRGLFGGRRREVLPIEAVRSVGTHAVMVESVEAISDPADAPHEVMSSVERSADVTDDMVVTESGRQLGHVRDVVLSGGGTPRVVGFQIGGGPAGDGFVPIGTHTAVSASALIVPDGFENRVRTDLTELAGDLADLDTTKFEGGGSR
ncbi:MAG: PRC-barrel domain-containing protein [Ilumatobacteraceae bacterium]